MDIGFNLTTSCNKACDFCFLDLDGKDIDLEIFVQALDSGSFNRVTLSGGEPLMRKNIWNFLDETQKRNLGVNIITNGILLNETMTERLAEYAGFKLYVSYHHSNNPLRKRIEYAREKGISTHGHIVLESPAYNNIKQIFDDLSSVDSVMILYPTNTGNNSKVKMFGVDEWKSMVQQVLTTAEGYDFEVYYEPAFAKRNMLGLEKIICPAGDDPFIHADGKTYPCCLLVDTELGIGGTFDPLPFDYRECPILNVEQDVENEMYRRICPLVFTDARTQNYVFPSRIEELKNE